MNIAQPGSDYSFRVARGVLATCEGPVSRYSNHVFVEGLDRPVSVFPTVNAAAVNMVVVGTDGAFTVTNNPLLQGLLIEPTLVEVQTFRVHLTATRGRRATLHLSNGRLGVRVAIAVGVMSATAIRQVNELCRAGLVTSVMLAGGRLSLNGEVRVGTEGNRSIFGDFNIEFDRGVCRIADPRATASVLQRAA